jgi:hypothetical protein
MPEDLDDYDIDRARAEEDELREYGEPPYGEPPRRRSRIDFPVILAIVGVLAIAIMAVLFLVFRRPATPAATPVTVATPPMALATPTPGIPLPPLEESDGFVRGIAQALSAHPDFARWIARNGLVRTLTVVVDNVANGETPRPHLEFLAPKQRFKALRRPGRQTAVPDPAGFKGYDTFADVIGALDANAVAAAYRSVEPLFDAAYKELGHPEGGFRKGLDRATQALLAVPVLREDVALVPHAIAFRYEDPKLEKLTPAQKQFLRIGPRNVRIVQGKLKELQAALAAAPAETP